MAMSHGINLTLGEVLYKNITDGTCVPKEPVPLPDGLKYFLLVVLIIMFLVCVLGNSLTLMALSYVRSYYKKEFHVLRGPQALLLLQLSAFDLLYGLIGFPHFIQALLADSENPFNDMDVDHGAKWCWTLATLRNFFAEADFATVGALAVIACKQRLCKTCNNSGNYLNHAKHDAMFEKKWIYRIIYLTWILAAASIAPEALGITGNYVWSNTFYGCDAVFCGQLGYGMMTNICLNIVVMMVCYQLVAKQINYEMKMTSDRIIPADREMFVRHMRLVLILSVSYCICVLPASLISWGQFDMEGFFPSLNAQLITTSICNIIYWCMFSINFILYLCCFNSGIKRSYVRFYEDMKTKLMGKTVPSLSENLSISVISTHSYVHKHYQTELVREWSLEEKVNQSN